MNKKMAGLLTAGFLIFGLAGTVGAGGNRENSGKMVLTVGATPVPHAELLNLVKGDLAAEGIELRVREFNDYATPNAALLSGDIDANFSQHLPHLESNPEWQRELIAAFGIHVEPLGLYTSSLKNIADFRDGASIAIPNDPTNGGRALLLLQSRGLITLEANAGLIATPLNVISNPRNLRFRELEAALLPRALGDVDAAVINGNYALAAGLNPVRDSLIIEGADSPYVNIVAVRRGMERAPRILALERALKSQKVKDYINSHYDGGVVAIF